ncbi:MAG: hypothetical protein ACREE4_13435 [Stellaceae bacterium]
MTPKSSDYGRVFFQAEVFRAGRLAERRPHPSDTIIARARRLRKASPRTVSAAVLQALLLRQGVVLRQTSETAAAAK